LGVSQQSGHLALTNGIECKTSLIFTKPIEIAIEIGIEIGF